MRAFCHHDVSQVITSDTLTFLTGSKHSSLPLAVGKMPLLAQKFQ